MRQDLPPRLVAADTVVVERHMQLFVQETRLMYGLRISMGYTGTLTEIQHVTFLTAFCLTNLVHAALHAVSDIVRSTTTSKWFATM